MQKLNYEKIALVIFISFELCYYLLIAQTGIVEYFQSNILKIIPLPIGGVIGSILSFYIKSSTKIKIRVFLFLQLLITLFYPNLNFIMLFILGISVGALAPLLINELKKASTLQLGLALIISYTLGTFLFNYEVQLRGPLSIGLTIVAIISSYYLPKEEHKGSLDYSKYSLFAMILWIFLDSALFETLSRDITISIWRDGYSFEIATFHIIGVVVALIYNINKTQKGMLIISLFAISYLFFFLEEPLLLSMTYPFVISYYNVVILQNILNKELKTIGVYMIFIGWFASGAGLFVALENLIIFVPLVILVSLLYLVHNEIKTNNKELYYA